MAQCRDLPGEEESREALRERVRLWWMAVLAGQADQSHPVHGADVNAHVDGDALVITGSVPTEHVRREVERETQHLLGHGIARVRNELQVAARRGERKGVLVQTLLCVYETAEQAGSAAGYLEGHASIKPGVVRLIPPGDVPAGMETARAMLPAAFLEDVERALNAGRALLLVTVDEVDAFRARELLDEETRSLRTLVLPPEPARTVGRARDALRRAEAAKAGRAKARAGEAPRERARVTERTNHEA